MRVSVIAPLFFPEPNGLSVSVYQRCLSLRRMGHDVQLVLPNYSDHTAVDVMSNLHRQGVRTAFFPTTDYGFTRKELRTGRVPQFITSARVVGSLVEQFEPELIFFDNPHFFFMFSGHLPAFDTPTLRNVTRIAICHSNLPLVFQELDHRVLASIMRKMMPFVLNSFHHTVYPSDFVKNSFPTITSAASIDFLGVDKSLFPLVHRNKSSALTVLSVGRISSDKGIKFLYDVASENSEWNNQIRWVFVGWGPDLPYWQSRQTRNITFVGHVDHNSLPSWYDTSDIFVSACGFESFGLTISEAMSSGLPVLLPDKGGASDRVRSAKTGFLYHLANKRSFCEKLNHLIANPRECEDVGRRASESVLSWDDATNMLLQYSMRGQQHG